MRVGGRAMLSKADTRSLNEWEEWAASTDSRKFSEEGVLEGIVSGVGLEPARVNWYDHSTGVCKMQTRGVAATYLFRPLATDSHKKATSALFRILRIDKEIWTSDNAHLHYRVHDEGEANGVLLATKKAFGSVYRIDSPHTWPMHRK